MRVTRLTISNAWAAVLGLTVCVVMLAISFEPAKSGGQTLGFLLMLGLFFAFGRRRLRQYLQRRDEALRGAPRLPADARPESPLRWLKRQLLGGTLDATLYLLARYLLFVMIGVSLGLDAAGPVVAGAFAAPALQNLIACLRFAIVERRLGKRVYEEWRPPEQPVLLYVS
jgi:hypothetical protein